MRYRGTLEVEPARRDGGLSVEFDLSERHLTVTSSGDVLGRYPIEDISVARVGSARFELRIGSEELVFTAEDALRFSYEAMPLIQAARPEVPVQVMNRVRSWWRDLTAADEATVIAGLGDLNGEAPVAAGAAPAIGERSVAPPAPPPHVAQVPAPPAFGAKGEVVETCKGLRSDGKVCGSAVVGERGFCFAHDPDRVAERRMILEQTTRAADRMRRSSSDNLGDVVARLERAVAEVHEGRLEPERAMAMASLAQAMIGTIELAKSEEAGKESG